MAKKQLKNQLRKIKTKESMDKRREGQVHDVFSMQLEDTRGSRHYNTTFLEEYSSYTSEEW